MGGASVTSAATVVESLGHEEALEAVAELCAEADPGKGREAEPAERERLPEGVTVEPSGASSGSTGRLCVEPVGAASGSAGRYWCYEERLELTKCGTPGCTVPCAANHRHEGPCSIFVVQRRTRFGGPQ